MERTRKMIDVIRPTEYTGEDNDCAVFAIAAATGMPYGAAHRELELFGRKRGRGTKTALFLAWKGYKLANYKIIPVYVREHRNQPWLPVWKMRAMTQSGRYLVRVTSHVFAVVDGVEYDVVSLKAGKHVTGIWKLEAL